MKDSSPRCQGKLLGALAAVDDTAVIAHGIPTEVVPAAQPCDTCSVGQPGANPDRAPDAGLVAGPHAPRT